MLMKHSIWSWEYTLAIRKFMYLLHILHRDTDELILKVYKAQSCKVNKGDWARIIQEEKEKFSVTESDDQIACMSQGKFKNMIKKKVKKHAIQYLHQLAQPHSKSDNLEKNKFKRQQYLTDRRFSKEDVQLLFTLRTKMLYCKSNFRNQFQHNMCCRICKVANTVEDEEHILTCKALNSQVNPEAKFSHVYGNVNQQYEIVQVFKNILRRRKVYLDIAGTAASNPSA